MPPGCMNAVVPRLRTSNVRPSGPISRAAAMRMVREAGMENVVINKRPLTQKR
ncbi:hypothetical protein D3C84_1161070 [compost metagenome]